MLIFEVIIFKFIPTDYYLSSFFTTKPIQYNNSAKTKKNARNLVKKAMSVVHGYLT